MTFKEQSTFCSVACTPVADRVNLTATSVNTCARRISALNHEILDNSMELETIIITTPRQLGKITACHWCMLPVQLQLYCTHPATSPLVLFLYTSSNFNNIQGANMCHSILIHRWLTARSWIHDHSTGLFLSRQVINCNICILLIITHL